MPEATPLATITYAELKRHSRYEDAWISVDGVVYDITKFIDAHPFGDTFRGNLGTECGGLFAASHVNTNAAKMLASDKFRAKHDISIIGRLDGSRDHLHKSDPDPYLDRLIHRPMADDPFWQDLKEEVCAFLRDTGESIHYSLGQGLALVAYYFVIAAVLSWLAWFQGSLLAAALLGFHMLCAVAHVSHMATHFGFTRHPWLNFLAQQFFDLGGMSWLEWQIAHQTHHNQPHSVIDQQTNVYDDTLLTRIHRYIEQRPRHRYQHIYFWVIVSQYLLFRLVGTTWWMLQNRRFIRHWYEMAAHLFARAVFVSLVVYAVNAHGWLALWLFLSYATAYSYAAFILLYNDHADAHAVIDDAADIRRYHGRTSWAEVQVRTSNDWYPTNWLMAFIEFHYGYFNYHIEHHLFPTFKPTLMKKVSPVVQRVCRRHGIPYTRTTFLEVQVSLQEHFARMGTLADVRASADDSRE